MDLNGLLVYLPALLLHFVRAGAFFAAVPLFGAQRDSRILRLILAVSTGTIFWWVGEKILPIEGGLIELMVLALREALLGLVAGFAVSLMTSLLISAGEIISHEMGFSLARTMNPESGVSSSVVSQFFQAIGALLIFQLNVHHEVIRLLAFSYERVPTGQPYDTGPMFGVLTSLVEKTLLSAVQYALPILAVMMLLTSVLVMLARAVPNINLLEFSFGLRILLALFSASYFLGQGAPFLERVFAEMLAEARLMFV